MASAKPTIPRTAPAVQETEMLSLRVTATMGPRVRGREPRAGPWTLPGRIECSPEPKYATRGVPPPRRISKPQEGFPEPSPSQHGALQIPLHGFCLTVLCLINAYRAFGIPDHWPGHRAGSNDWNVSMVQSSAGHFTIPCLRVIYSSSFWAP